MPRVTPDAAALSEVELALLGVGPTTLSFRVPSDTAPGTAYPEALTIVDVEGAPVARLDVTSVSETGGGHAVTGTVHAVRDGGTEPPRGPFAEFRRGPDQVDLEELGETVAIVGHDPIDSYSLEAAVATDSATTALLVVLDGPRATPGPGVAEVAPSVLALRDELREAGRTAEVLVLPAPHYGDRRDDELAQRVAAAYGASRVVPDRRPDPATLREWLDGSATTPVHDWPATSLDAWRRWRPAPARRGLVILFTGLSGSGKSTVARAVTDRILELGWRQVTLLDGDVVRRNLSAGLGFSRADRDRNVERIGFVAAEIARHGGIAICAPLAPFAATRARVREMAETHGDFLLVYVATPLAECERRDRKGLYAQARAGQIPDFTGVSSPYERPEDADLVIDTSQLTIPEARDRVMRVLHDGRRLGDPA